MPATDSTGTRVRVPDFFLIGVPRAATTSLYYGLGDHPRIFAPSLKEACFTCTDIDPGVRRTPTRWFEDRADYLEQFSAARADQIIGEGCIYNVYSREAPARIRELNPSARMIIQLRDPIDQMRSNHALKLIMLDLDDRDFARTMRSQAAARVPGAPRPTNMGEFDLRDKATVSGGLARFIEEFGRARIHVNLYDDFARDPVAAFRATFRFLGVDDSHSPPVRQMVPNRTTLSDSLNRAMGEPRVVGAAKQLVPRPLHPVARRVAHIGYRFNRRRVSRDPIDGDVLDELRAEFRPEVERLSELVGQDLVARWWASSPIA